jgi:hypothetical protein
MVESELRQSALIPAFLLIAIMSFSGGAVGSTHLYLIEQYICRERYTVFDPQNLPDVGLIDEALCKFPEIQSKVVKSNGIYQFLCFLPGQYPQNVHESSQIGRKLTVLALILTGPWGKLTLVFGKKNVLFLNTLGYVLGQSYFITVCKSHDIHSCGENS